MTRGKKRMRRRRRKSYGTMLVPVVAVVVLLVVILSVFRSFITHKPVMKMTGEDVITLEVYDKYVEPGVSAKVGSTDLSEDIHVTGSVNTEQPGTYTLTYELNYDGKKCSKTRTIHVVDTQAPVLTLEKAGQEVFASSIESYKDPGLKAVDNFDGNITRSVDLIKEPVDESSFKVIYRVWDQAGNKTEAERMVTIKDVFAPEIVLKGDAAMTIKQGDGFTDPGYEAVDDLDGDLTKKVEVSGYVDGYLPGNYTLTYKIKDKAGNEAEVQRSVVVEAHESFDGDSVIYLTFDDGPSTVVTDQVLDVLERNNITATFFIIDYQPEQIPVLKRIVELGNTIGIHTLSHEYDVCYGTDTAYLDGVHQMQKRLKEDIGYDAFCCRFPGGSSNTISAKYNPGVMTKLAAMVLEDGIQYYDWNVDSTDAQGNNRPVETLSSNVINGLKKGRGNIVLCHDTNAKETTAQMLQTVIDYGKANGYTFAAIEPDTAPVHHAINN